MSSDLIWQLVKHHNSKLLKRDGALFSTEAGNLANVHSFKHSGLANQKALDVQLLQSKQSASVGVSLGIKRRSAANKPVHEFARSNIAKIDLSRAARKLGTSIKKQSRKNFYRRDLVNTALARWSLLHLVARRAAGQLRKANIGSRRYTRATKAIAHKKAAKK